MAYNQENNIENNDVDDDKMSNNPASNASSASSTASYASNATKDNNNYDKQLKEINIFFNIVLEEVVTLIPKYNTYPNIKTYADMYSHALQNFKEVENKFFLFKNTIEKNLSNVKSKANILDNEINRLDKNINYLKKQLQSLENSNSAGQGMLVDAKFLHNQKYAGNVILFGVMVGVIIMFYKNNKTA